MFHVFKNYILVSLLILSFNGCSSKVHDFTITQKLKPISDEELSKMTAKEFHKFMSIKNLYHERNFTYTNAYEIVSKYCKLKGSDLIAYTPSNQTRHDIQMRTILKDDYDRRMSLFSSETYYGCNLYDTDEYLELTVVFSFGRERYAIGDLVKDNTYFLEYDATNRYEFRDFMENLKLAKYDKYNYGKYTPEYNGNMEKLRNRKGTFEQFYYDTAIYKDRQISIIDDDYDRSNFSFGKKIPYTSEDECALVCKQENMKNNGYDIFKDSLRENWKLQATSNIFIKNKFATINNIKINDCTCLASRKYTLKK